MKLALAHAATTAAILDVASAAHATGAGTYAVEGQGPDGANPYHGTAELTQTGQGTWRMQWQVGGESRVGTGVGDSQAFAVSYASASRSGTALYVSDGKSGYRAIWAGPGDAEVGIETLTPAAATTPKP